MKRFIRSSPFCTAGRLLFIIQSGATAAVAVAFAQYLIRLLHLPTNIVTPLAIAVLVALALFHALGIKPGAMLLNVITFGKTMQLLCW
ncbi:MAG: hypothetical protein U0Y68_02120 [Blastocatellia bacterium]